jgi:hypothetical protein
MGSSYKEQELIRRSVDQFFGEFALVTKNAPRTANVTAVTFVKLVALGKTDYERLNAAHNNGAWVPYASLVVWTAAARLFFFTWWRWLCFALLCGVDVCDSNFCCALPFMYFTFSV